MKNKFNSIIVQGKKLERKETFNMRLTKKHSPSRAKLMVRIFVTVTITSKTQSCKPPKCLI